MMKRVYVVPLKSSVVKAPSYKRAKKAVNALRQFMFKHMKAEEVKVGRFLNEKIWERGIKRPPSKVKVEAVKDDKGVVSVELMDLSKKALNIIEEEKKEKALSEKSKKSVKKLSDKTKTEGLSDLVSKASSVSDVKEEKEKTSPSVSDVKSDAKKEESANDTTSSDNESKSDVEKGSVDDTTSSDNKSKSD